jgi:hypothetical protein
MTVRLPASSGSQNAKLGARTCAHRRSPGPGHATHHAEPGTAAAPPQNRRMTENHAGPDRSGAAGLPARHSACRRPLACPNLSPSPTHTDPTPRSRCRGEHLTGGQSSGSGHDDGITNPSRTDAGRRRTEPNCAEILEQTVTPFRALRRRAPDLLQTRRKTAAPNDHQRSSPDRKNPA